MTKGYCEFCGAITDRLTNEFMDVSCVDCANDLATMEPADEATLS